MDRSHLPVERHPQSCTCLPCRSLSIQVALIYQIILQELTPILEQQRQFLLALAGDNSESRIAQIRATAAEGAALIGEWMDSLENHSSERLKGSGFNVYDIRRRLARRV